MSAREADWGRERPAGVAALAARLAAYLDDDALLRQALTHRSFSAEVAGEASNERLEFLGDAVLGLVVGEHLYAILPDLPEGDLARMRAAVVSEEALAPVAADLDVGGALRLGRGEVVSGGRAKPSILADALEALIGAAYLTSGLERARAFVLDVMGEAIGRAAEERELGDPKNRLQELGARLGLGAPRYELGESGPDHARRYEATVVLDGRSGEPTIVGRGAGRSKKHAERAAAAEALARLAESAGA